MPSSGGDDGLVFLADIQTSKFSMRTATPMVITDKASRAWAVEAGLSNADEQHFGLFDAGVLVARIALSSPAMSAHLHPPPCWSIGRVQVIDKLQCHWIAHQLVETIVGYRRAPLASDLDQTNGGRAMWETLIRRNSGKVELYGPQGNMGPITGAPGAYNPAPWQFDDRRLILNP